MRTRWMLGAILFLAGVSGLCLALSAHWASPLHCADSTFDYGAVGGSQPIDHVFKITNAGKNPLNGLNAITSCRCTSASLSQTSIAPGQSALVQVRMDMRPYLGPQKHRIFLSSDDRSVRPLVLTMQGTILDQ